MFVIGQKLRKQWKTVPSKGIEGNQEQVNTDMKHLAAHRLSHSAWQSVGVHAFFPLHTRKP
jgi:hypothetical protein